MRGFGLIALVALLTTGGAQAQDNFPTQTVKIVLPSAPGSTTDILTRLTADGLSRKWNKPVVVENIAGGSMNIGAAAVARAAPDGYTLFVAPPAPLSLAHLLTKNITYNPLDWVPITMLAKIANVLSVRNTLPANTLAGLIAYGKANPGKLTFATQGLDREPVGGAARSAGRHQDAGGRLSRRAARAHRCDRRQCRHVLRHARHLGAAASRRQAENPRGR
jgi:tripartite-type tricarboxylate transporter receptor subunit TctC